MLLDLCTYYDSVFKNEKYAMLNSLLMDYVDNTSLNLSCTIYCFKKCVKYVHDVLLMQCVKHIIHISILFLVFYSQYS